MTLAICHCKNGHTFTTRVTGEDPDMAETEVSTCPQCDADFEIIDMEHDEP